MAKKIVGGVVFYSVRVVSNESRRLVLLRTFFYQVIWKYQAAQGGCEFLAAVTMKSAVF